MSEWAVINKFDQRGVALYERHYSCRRYADGRVRRQFAPPGETLLLLRSPLDTALFGWVKNKVPRYDRQVGVNCFVFRNESTERASELIREAMRLAWNRWPKERLFTYVDSEKVASEVPGYCFRRAGWKRCGESKSGLLIFEALP